MEGIKVGRGARVVVVVGEVKVVDVVELPSALAVEAKLDRGMPALNTRARKPAESDLLRRNKVKHPTNVVAIETRTPVSKWHLIHSASLRATFAEGVVEAVGRFLGIGFE